MFLEFIWNKTVVLQYPIRYKIHAMGANCVVTHWIKVGDKNRKFILLVNRFLIFGWVVG